MNTENDVPADDVRELVERMRRAGRAVYLATDATVADDISDMLRRAADVLDVRPRGTVTEAQIEAAARAIAKDDPEFEEGTYGIEDYLNMARAALEAAREVLS